MWGRNSAAPERSAGAKRKRSVFVGVRLEKSSDFVQERQQLDFAACKRSQNQLSRANAKGQINANIAQSRGFYLLPYSDA